MMENGKATFEMVLECRFGQTAQNMKGTGRTIEHLEKESSIM